MATGAKTMEKNPFGLCWTLLRYNVLICVDAFSKYPYVTMLNVGLTTSKHTNNVLEQIFAIEGLPDTNVTDNGPQFVSNEFDDFCVHFNINHLTSPVFHPASNRKAKRFA